MAETQATPAPAVGGADTLTAITQFLDEYYRAELLEQARKHLRFLPVDFTKLAAFNPEIGDSVLDHPEEYFKLFELAAEDITEKRGFIVRFTNLPKTAKARIRDIRSTNIGKFIVIEGIVKNKTDVRPHVTAARFECPSCGNNLTVLQLDNNFKEPQRCSCGRKGKFRLLSKELVDAQGTVVEENPELMEGGEQPKRFNVFLKNDLVSPLSERRTNPGAKVLIAGIVKEVPQILRSGGQSTRFDLMIEANNAEPIEEAFTELTIDPDEMEKIKALAEDPKLMQKLVASIAPGIYGHEKIKEALVLMLAGGVRKRREGGLIIRGDIHVMLVGDPGSAKSQLLKRITLVAPRARYVTGKGVTGAGLSASVVRDDFLHGWALEAGALVLANGGICAIDELDKMSKEDSWAMHEALEQQTVTISKANIQASLRCETTVLAAANPKWGRFDPYDTVSNQIDIPVTLINRFDLIFPIKDLPEAKKDERMARFILRLHKDDVDEPAISTQLLRKYLAYARQNVFPKLTDAAIDEIREYYVRLRTSAVSEGIKAIPITARQLEGLVRLAEAHARLRLNQKVTRKDAAKAIEILDYCLRQVAYDEKTGTLDIDRIATDMPASQRNKIVIIKEIIIDLENKLGKTVPVGDVLQAAQEKDITESEVDEVIQKLKRAGDVYEPKPGYLSRI